MLNEDKLTVLDKQQINMITDDLLNDTVRLEELFDILKSTYIEHKIQRWRKYISALKNGLRHIKTVKSKKKVLALCMVAQNRLQKMMDKLYNDIHKDDKNKYQM